MKSLLILGAMLAASVSAQADWAPFVDTRIYTATVNVNGGSASYSENRASGGPISKIVPKLLSAPYQIQQGINAVLAEQVARNGFTFLGGTVSGNLSVSIRPDISGAVFVTVSGVSYQARTGYSGTKLGIISYDCVNTLTLSNISITAQYGAANGLFQADKTGFNATPASSTDCDSNLSWIMPLVGDYIIDTITARIDSRVVSGIQASIGNIKDSLFYAPDQNLLVGLNQLIPRSTVVTTPGGGTFPIGEYVQNNMAYLLSSSRIDITLDKGTTVNPVYGITEPSIYTFSGNIMKMTLSSPALSFGLQLNDSVEVSWDWKCSIRNPLKRCNIP